MNKVCTKRIGDIVTFKRGYDLPASVRLTGKYPVVSSGGISGYHSEYKKDGEGIITGRYGTLGEVYYVNEKYWPHNTTLYSINFHGNCPKYVFYLMKCLGNLKTSDKSTVPGINRNDLHELVVPFVEDKKQQQKTAAVLSALDDKIELNNKINATLEAMAKTLYDYWFVQADFPDENGKPYQSSGGKMVWHETLKREIPEGWEVKSLFDVASVQYGFPFRTEFFNEEEKGYPIIRIRDINDNTTSNYSTERDVDEKYRLEAEDVLIGMDGNFHINYWSKDHCYLNQRVVRIRRKDLANMYVRYQVEPYIQLREKSVSRTTVGHLSDKDLKAIRIIIPETHTKLCANNLFDKILNQLISNQKQNHELAALRNWLLPMLMNGQVSVGEAYEQAEEALSIAAEGEPQYKRK